MPVNIDLSSTDAWDDSALVDTWNQALREYKKYHSIHVQGKDLSDVLTKEELEELSKSGIEVEAKDEVNGEANGEGGYDENGEVGDDTTIPQVVLEPSSNIIAEGAPSSSRNHPSPASVPDFLLNSVQDESMKNLMISWYWAGYYTGFQEGEKSGQQKGPG